MFIYRYEDGDAEHLQWPELKVILLALPANEGDEDSATPAVTTKAKKRVAATGGIVQILSHSNTSRTELTAACTSHTCVSAVYEHCLTCCDQRHSMLFMRDKALVANLVCLCRCQDKDCQEGEAVPACQLTRGHTSRQAG